MARRLRIGLTGGIASGKSIITQRFAELEVPVVDADLVSRLVVEPGSAGLAQVAARFGAKIIAADGSLNRAGLRDIVFSDSAARRDLDALLHPLIRVEMERQADAAVGPYLVMAIPLLVEGGRPHDRVDRVLVVDVDEETQLERLLMRDGSSPAQARAILAAQASRQQRLQFADDVLVNTGSVTDLRQSVDHLHEKYLALAAV